MEQYQNPVINSDFPDPDIIRVGDAYYMASTTMYLMPGGDILRSRDLVHWEFLCHVFSQLEDNPAHCLEDGQQIYVPSREEAEQGITGGKSQADSPGAKPAAGDTEAKDGKVSINTASKEQLMTLNGIGEAKAAAIIRYREEHGGFQKIEELKEVEGIKEGVFNKVKDQIII